MAKKTTRRRAETLVQRSRRMAPSEKAYLHDVQPGRRPFLGLTAQELKTIAAHAGKGIVLRWSRS